MSEIKSSHSVEEKLHIQTLKLGRQLKRIIEQDARIVDLEAERDALAVYIEAMRRDLQACQNVLFSLAHSGEVTPAYAADAKKVLQSTPVQCLAEIRAKAIESIADDETIAFVKPHCGSHGAMLIYDYISVRAAKVRRGGE